MLDTPPSPSSAPAWRPSITQRAAAKRATDELFKFCELPDTGDPESFLAAVGLILSEFPTEVMQAVVHPAHGLPSQMRRPALCDVRAACEAAYSPLARKLARDKIAAEQRLRLASPEAGPKLTPEEIRGKFPGLVVDEDADFDLAADKRDDPVKAKAESALDATVRERTDQGILREYAALKSDPIYAAPGLLVSPSLARLIRQTS